MNFSMMKCANCSHKKAAYRLRSAIDELYEEDRMALCCSRPDYLYIVQYDAVKSPDGVKYE